MRILITLQLEQKFKSIPEMYQQKIAVAQDNELLYWAQCLLRANCIEQVFE